MLLNLEASAGLRLRRGLYAPARALRFTALALLVALSLVPYRVPARVSEGDEPVRRVVVLNATDPYLPAFLALDGALRAAIRADTAAPVEF